MWLADLHLPAEERDAASRAARVAPRIASALREREHKPSELRALLGREPPEALALALALRAPAEPVLKWVTSLRPVQLEISGADLLAAGVPEGPAVGRALDETLNRKLDDLVSGRDEELETALLLAREHAQ
jgi:tRNA nucleotidyltransferase (CCA-adding enzyme)